MAEHRQPFADVRLEGGAFSIPDLKWRELVFVGGAMDRYLRAFDLETGRELWKAPLPAGGQATPMTYRAGKDERQYIVIAAGGHGPLGVPRGDSIVAFALP